MAREKNESELAVLMNAVLNGQVPEVNEEEVLAEHTGLMDLLVQAGRDGGFTVESIAELAPEEFQDGGENEDVSSRLELVGFVQRATERCGLAPITETPGPAEKPKRKKQNRGKKKAARGRKKKAADVSTKKAGGGTRANSITQRTIAVLKTAANARKMKDEAGSIAKLLKVLQKDHGLTDLTNGNLLSILYKTLEIGKKG